MRQSQHPNGTSPRLSRRVAEVLRVEMARQRVSQAELAQRVGTSQQAVSRRISGRSVLNLDELHQYAHALGLDPQDVLRQAASEQVPA